MFLCAMLGGGLVGVMVERFAYRRLRNAPRIAPLITALGVSFFLENGAQLVLGAQFQSYNSFSWSNTRDRARRHSRCRRTRNVSYAQVIVVVGDDRPDGRTDALRAAHADREGDARDRRSTARRRR